MITVLDLWRYILLAAGLGFVIFFHELGHFLAAKYSDVRVDQFAVGFGPAIVAWRKGLGLRRGTTTPEAERRVEGYLESKRVGEKHEGEAPAVSTQRYGEALAALGLGETEYRLNWIPLGGYVKMLGQDDMDPTAVSQDPRAYNQKPIRLRMLIISAGVLMNVLLAGIGFMAVFLMGFKAPPAVIGGVLAGSPASMATADDGSRKPLTAGDRILYFDGKFQHDFAKVALYVALVREGDSVPVVVRHQNGTEETLHVTPARPPGDPAGLLAMGIMPSSELRGFDVTDKIDSDLSNRDLFPADVEAVKPGETITAINDQPLTPADAVSGYWKLSDALAAADGDPVRLTVTAPDGSTRQTSVLPHFEAPFGIVDLDFAGMVPRAHVNTVVADSPAATGKLHAGDVVQAITVVQTHNTINFPSQKMLRETINAAGQNDQSIVLTLADASGATRQTEEIVPNAKLGEHRRGLGVGLDNDERNTTVAVVEPDSAAGRAGIKPGWQITKVGDQAVSNFFQVRRMLAGATAGVPLSVTALTADGPVTVQFSESQGEIDAMKYMTFSTDVLAVLHERTELRKTANPIVASEWGAAETRDFILQFYVTLHRMFTGSVPLGQAMGPVGIVRFGAMSAARGPDWLVWFLSMISANLAVANFLPIPVMDGGLFVLLLLEGVQGRPLSPKTQQVIQMVGLAFILSLFLLVTYQDITR